MLQGGRGSGGRPECWLAARRWRLGAAGAGRRAAQAGPPSVLQRSPHSPFHNHTTTTPSKQPQQARACTSHSRVAHKVPDLGLQLAALNGLVRARRRALLIRRLLLGHNLAPDARVELGRANKKGAEVGVGVGGGVRCRQGGRQPQRWRSIPQGTAALICPSSAPVPPRPGSRTAGAPAAHTCPRGAAPAAAVCWEVEQARG